MTEDKKVIDEYEKLTNYSKASYICSIFFFILAGINLISTMNWESTIFDILIPLSFGIISLLYGLSIEQKKKKQAEGLFIGIIGTILIVVSIIFLAQCIPLVISLILGAILAIYGYWMAFKIESFFEKIDTWNKIKYIFSTLFSILFIILLPILPIVLSEFLLLPICIFGMIFLKIWYSNYYLPKKEKNEEKSTITESKQDNIRYKQNFLTKFLWKFKKNPLFWIITLIFSIWGVFLIIFLIDSLSTGKIIHFIDASNGIYPGNDVSNEYSSVLPLSRYIFEPIISLTFILGFNSDPTERFPFFFLIYLGLRLLIFIIKDLIFKDSKKKGILMCYISNTLEFFVKIASSALLGIAIIFLILFFTEGFIEVANNFLYLLRYMSLIAILGLVGKIIYNSVIFLHPKLSLVKRKIIKSTRKSSNNKVILSLIDRARMESVLFLCVFLFFFSLNSISLSFHYPTQRIVPTVPLSANEVLFDFHVHTTESDGHLTPEQRVMWYIDQGIDGAAFADHSNVQGSLRARRFVERNNLDFTVIVAQEFTDDPEGLHLNVYGIEVDLTPEGYSDPPGPNPMNCSDMIQWVKANGGWVTVNHYRTNESAPFSYEELRDWGVDGFEIINGGGIRVEEIRAFCKANDLICIAGSDIHMNGELNTFTRLTLDDPNNRTIDAIFTALNKNTHECIAIYEYDYYHDVSSGDDFEEFIMLARYFSNMDVFQSISWILWSILIYLRIIFRLKIIKKVDLDKLTRKIID